MYTKAKQRWIELQEKEKESSDEDDDDDDGKSLSDKKKVVPLWKRLNKDGYTPLTLAAKLGHAEMFSFLLDERKITQWSYGPVSCVLYPLDQVDLEFQDDEVKRKKKSRLLLINKQFQFIFRMMMIKRLVHLKSLFKMLMLNLLCIRVLLI